jgi:hypothetical protein
MATATLTNGDMPVTIKLNVDGTSRRLKLPLRDLTREALEPKVRRESFFRHNEVLLKIGGPTC